MSQTSLPWLISLGRKRGVYFLPVILLLILCAAYYWAYSTALDEPLWYSKTQIFGMLMLYAFLPPYLLAGLVKAWQNNEDTTLALDNYLNDVGNVLRQKMNYTPKWLVLSMIVGLFIGVNGFVAIRQTGLSSFPIFFWCLAFGNTLVWIIVGYSFAMRLPTSIALYKLGRDGVRISIHDQIYLKPFANIAFKDLIFVIGALALMGLQSIDQEIRWENYNQGLILGLPMAAIVFLMPLLGVHKAMHAAKQKAMSEISLKIRQAKKIPTTELELLLSYQDRLHNLNTWPLDIRAVSRVVFYLIIPPLAWVAAALVENWISSFL